MKRLDIPAPARNGLEQLAELRRERPPTEREKRAQRRREAEARERHERTLAAARRVMTWAHGLAATGALAGLGDVVIFAEREGRTSRTAAVNGSGEVYLCTGSYMGGTSLRCRTAEELALGFIAPDRIEAAISSGKVWEHLQRFVAEEGRRRGRG